MESLWKPFHADSNWCERIRPSNPQERNTPLKKLDPSVAKRIVDQITWLAQHFEEIKPESLKGDLAGFFKYREGDYRIIYELLRKEKVIVIHEIGHRSKVYKKAKP